MSTFFPTGFLGGGPGGGEIILIFVVVLLMFGPKRLPQIARMIGKTLDELRRASQDFKDQIMSIDEPPPVDVESSEEPYGDEDYDAYGSGEYNEYTGEEGDGFDGHAHEEPGADVQSDADGSEALDVEEQGDVSDALDVSLAVGGAEPAGEKAEPDAPQGEEEETQHGLAG